VQSTLSHLDGVIQAEVNFDAKTATVKYDSARTQPDKIASGLSQATNGKYTAKVKS